MLGIVKSDIERGLSEKEIAEEKLVLRTFIGEMEPNIQVENSHSRDQRIEFNSDVEISMNLIKSSKVNSFGFDIKN